MSARRASYRDQAVTYGAIGATRTDEHHFWRPPRGYRPLSRRVRLGSGEARFRQAAAELMTWGVQRGSGIAVANIEAGTGEEYAGLELDADGQPIGLREAGGGEVVYGEGGQPGIRNGMSAVLRIPFGPVHVDAPVRIVWTIDDEHEVGFGYGTLRGHPESGEEAFVVEHHDDDSVWFVLRAFSRPATLLSRLGAPIARLEQRRYTARYLRALHPSSGL